MTDGASAPTGIVPPYMDEQWRKLRAHLTSCAAIAAEASTYSTADEARPLIGRAMTELMDASFWCMHIERDNLNEPLDGVEP